MTKLALAAGDPDVEEWNFENSPMPYDSTSDLQEAFHLMEYFLQDLYRAIIQQELYNFSEVPLLYTALYPPATATSGRGLDRNKNKDEANAGIETVAALAEDREVPTKEVTISETPVPPTATRIIQIVTNLRKIRVFSSVKECRILNPGINWMEHFTHQR